jgi:hypothetical protein
VPFQGVERHSKSAGLRPGTAAGGCPDMSIFD